ncbi:MAG: response regulator, partial [Planctomycetes bacterium]|nr:response regulator [Planctomycetota bacterium]
MPVMDGFTFLKTFAQTHNLAHYHIFILTTSTAQHDILSAYDHNIRGYITKPVDFDEFVRAMKVLQNFWTITEHPST